MDRQGGRAEGSRQCIPCRCRSGLPPGPLPSRRPADGHCHASCPPKVCRGRSYHHPPRSSTPAVAAPLPSPGFHRRPPGPWPQRLQQQRRRRGGARRGGPCPRSLATAAIRLRSTSAPGLSAPRPLLPELWHQARSVERRPMAAAKADAAAVGPVARPAGGGPGGLAVRAAEVLQAP